MNRERRHFYSQRVSENSSVFQEGHQAAWTQMWKPTPSSTLNTPQEFADLLMMKMNNIVSKIDSLHPS